MKAHLAIVHGEIEMMQGMVGRPVNGFFKNMARDHIGVMDLQVI